ncbi:IS481 family transposase [Aestuariimicrobium sp. p3-SID1156]|uniref:IS481 family transposase n=1 Tax=unclassified Aestuariimicrobium TaxID=2625866 RepID=UPI00223BF49A|nr:IS481 family transposase [Aestuariimicrobium sp. p3-SID1156]MCT1459289.1 IS481 family transposase [Aestuariimicrobium sp. p3-SID1156]
MSHPKARLNVNGRLLLVQRVRVQGWPVAHAAKAMGISRQCAHHWLKRYDQYGESGLHDRSSRPHTMPRRTSPAVEARVLAHRAQYRRGPARIAAATNVPARTVTAILRRHHMPPLAHLDPITGAVIRGSQASRRRYERQRPGELIHIDVKKIGKIPDGGGWRLHGRAATSAAKNKRERIGYDYVHAAVDDCSRLAYVEIHDDEKGTTCAGFLTRAAAFFASQGITRIERIITDNAFAYRNSRDFKAAVKAMDAKQKFIKPHCPWQNGKVERLNRTLALEWAYRQPFTSNQARRDALADWLTFYNTERGHSALNGKPPITRVS